MELLHDQFGKSAAWKLCEPQASGLKRTGAAMASVKDIEGLLEGTPPVQYVAAGNCGVKYVSKGLEIVCLLPTGEGRVHYSRL